MRFQHTHTSYIWLNKLTNCNKMHMCVRMNCCIHKFCAVICMGLAKCEILINSFLGIILALASRFACFVSPLIPISSQRFSKRLPCLAKIYSPSSVMSSTRIRLLSILSTSGVLRILKQVDKYHFWTALKLRNTSFTWTGVSTALPRTIWYGYDKKYIR